MLANGQSNRSTQRPSLTGPVAMSLLAGWAEWQGPLHTLGGRLIRPPRYFTLQLAESQLTRRLFGQILGRIERLTGHPT